MTRARASALPANLPPRLLAREAAAAYIGLGTTKFVELVKDGRMPRPRRIDARTVWDVRQLDQAIDALPTAEDGHDGAPNPFDGVVM